MRVIFTLVFAFFFYDTIGQGVFISQMTGGDWNLGTTWDQTTCASGCSEGVDYPGPNDVAIILVQTGSFVNFPRLGSPSFSCKDLFIVNDIANSIRTSGITGVPSLTIHGQMSGALPDLSDVAEPTVNVFHTSASNLSLIFIGDNLDDPISGAVITSWGHNSPIYRSTFNAGIGNTLRVDSYSTRSSCTVQTGICQLNTSQEIRDFSGVSQLIVNSGSTINLQGTINGNGATNSFFSNVNVAGTMTTSSVSYVNATTFTLGSGATLNVGFNGADQDEGWWFETNRPSTFSIASTSTINFTASANQNIYSTSYGNLSLLSSGTKSVVGGGAFTINGDLTIANGVTLSTAGAVGISLLGDVVNNGSWAPSQLVKFEGSGTQSVSGNTITFGGGLDVGNASPSPATILDLQDNIDINGNLRVFANATLDLNEEDVSLSGNLTNNGTVAFGNPALSSFTFDGSTTFGGGATTLPSVIITGTVNAPAAMSVAGDFSNSGTFNASTGTVTFNGDIDQSITGVTTFNNVTISNTSTVNGVTPSSTMNLRGTLTLALSASKFNANGNLVVRSTGVNSGGRIAELPSTTNFTGNLTVERYIDGPDDWRYLSIPKQSATVEDLRDPTTFPVTGSFSDPSPADADVISPSAPSLYRWNASTQAWVAVGSGGTMASTALSNIGYAAYSYRTGNVTLSFSGSIYKGNTTVSLATTSPGWNLVPNPYPSAIDWDNVNRNGLDDEMHIRIANMTFASYVVGGPSANPPFVGWTGEVAIGQSFWVSSTSATSLTFEESDKTSNQYEFLRENEADNYFRITLASQTQKDETVVWFPEEATLNFDSKYDAKKRRNGCETCQSSGYLNLSSFTTDAEKDYAINGIPRIDCNDKIGLKVIDVTVGSYTLKFTDLDKLYLGYTLTLVDHFTNTEIVAEEGTEYTFDVTADANSYGSGRFEVEISTALINTSTPPAFTDLKECEEENVKVKLNIPQPGVNYQLWSGTNAISDLVTSTGGDITFVLGKDDLQQGSNLFTLKAATVDGCYDHDFTNALEYYFEGPASVTSVEDGDNCGEGTVTLEASGAPSNGYYNWYETSDATEPVFTSEEASFITPALTKSKSYFVSVVNGSGCESARSKVEANILYFDAPTVEVEGNTLTSSTGAAYQWYRNGEILTDKTSQVLQATESGDYTVTVTTSEGCSIASEAISFVVTGEADLIDMGVRVYPNPISSTLRITMPANFAHDVTKLSVFDVKGSEIALVADKDVIDSGEVTIDFKEKRSGQYILNIVSGRKVIALRLVKK